MHAAFNLLAFCFLTDQPLREPEVKRDNRFEVRKKTKSFHSLKKTKKRYKRVDGENGICDVCFRLRPALKL